MPIKKEKLIRSNTKIIGLPTDSNSSSNIIMNTKTRLIRMLNSNIKNTIDETECLGNKYKEIIGIEDYVLNNSDLKEETQNLAKPIRKGKKLFQKLRLVLKFQNQSELFKRINNEDISSPFINDSKLSKKLYQLQVERDGYSSSPLMKVYPSDKNFLTTFGKLDKLSKLKNFLSDNVILGEKLAEPISFLFYQIFLNCIESCESNRIREMIQLENSDHSLLLDSLFDNGCIVFYKIFIVMKHFALFNN